MTPNALTVLGTVMSVGVAVAFLPRGSFVAGPLLLAVVLVADSFDGILARATGRTSAFGAFLDSTMDTAPPHLRGRLRRGDDAVPGGTCVLGSPELP